MPAQTVIKIRRDTSTNWSSVNPTLAAGEIAFETDTNKIKVGDGSTVWASLDYASGAGTAAEITYDNVDADLIATTVKGALDELSNNKVDPADLTAVNTSADTTNFTGNLSGSDTTVQAALETLDDLDISAGVVTSDSPPSSPSNGDLWWESDTGILYIYYDNFWVEAVSGIVGPQGESGVLAVDSPITYDSGTSTVGISDATPTSVGVVLGSTSDSENVSLGNQSLESITTGGQNTSVGRRALQDVDTGSQNTALGFDALTSNTAGENTAVGTYAMQLNTTGNQNVAMGRNALLRNTTGLASVAVGYRSLQENTTGNYNTASGSFALQNNEDGSANVALGHESLQNNEDGSGNVAIGYESLQNSSSSTTAISIGNRAMQDALGFRGVAIGHRALSIDQGQYNVGIGWVALFNNDSGNSNTAVGRLVLNSNTTGNVNTAIGVEAGSNLTTGGNNSFLGNDSQPSSATVSNEITLGNSSITSLRCNVQSISSLSDQRDKTNIQDSPLGLDLIQRLRPVTFDWDRRDGSFAGMKDVGFIAQDVVEVEDELDIEDTLRMSYRENPEKLEVAPARLIPVLTKAIQELSEQNAELKARLDKLEGK